MNLVTNRDHIEIDWFQANRNYLVTHIEYLKYLLHISWPENSADKNDEQIASFLKEIAQQREATSAIFSLDFLVTTFNLSEFEKYTLIIAAANEFDSSFLKSTHSDANLAPSFSMALAILPNPEWDAILPSGNLRKWGLIKIHYENSLTQTLLHVPESIIHVLAGISGEDKEILTFSEPLNYAHLLLSKDNERQVASICQLAVQPNHSFLIHAFSMNSFFTLIGECRETKRNIAWKIGEQLKVNIRVMSSLFIPTTLDEMNDFITLWEREILLNNYLLYIECEYDVDINTNKEKMVDFFIDRLKWPVIIGCTEKRYFCAKDQFIFEVHKPSIQEQKACWKQLITDTKRYDEISQITSHFDLTFQEIQQCFSQLKSMENKTLWEICRDHSHIKMDNLAEKIIPTQSAKSLILPDRERLILEEIITHVKLRSVVYQDWGLSHNSTRGQGISVLFSGASGTGKTTAAEYLALSLNLNLYRIDLSAIVSKYIGETEKNLQKIFTAAEKSGAILLFDEADALFSKRTQVNDSKDRNANVEVSYLLQRIESFKGLAILTSNFKESIDKAFIRRLRFIIEFPFPSKQERELIWKAILPKEAPTEALDFKKLAQLTVAGGDINNITINACFFAAASQETLQMKHYLQASRNEYLKLEKNLSESEIHLWV